MRALSALGLAVCSDCRETARLRRFAAGPLSLIPVALSERKKSVKGARFVRGLRTLDRFLPFWNMEPEGKGAGGFRGLVPWRSMRQRLMRASGALPTAGFSPSFSS